MIYPEIEKKSQVLGTSSALGNFMLFGQSGGQTAVSALKLYRDSTAVSIPINKIAAAFASISPVIKIGDETIKSHPVLDLIGQPSPYFTRELFFKAMAIDYLVTDETEIVAVGNVNRPPLQMQTISPSNITIPEGLNGYPANIQVTGTTLTGTFIPKQSGKRLRYLADNLKEIKQIRGFSTKNNSQLRGESLLVSASKEVNQHIAGNGHNLSLLEKGGKLYIHFHLKDDLNDDDFATAKEKILSNYRGSNSSKVAVTSGDDMEIKEMGVNNRDMDFATLQKMAKEAVALQYNVPLPLVTVEASTLDNYKTAVVALYDDAVLPLADTLFSGLTDLLVPRFGLDPAKVKITYDAKSITALVDRELNQLKLRREINIETTDELRREGLGKDEISGGDVIYQQSSLIPLGEDLLSDMSGIGDGESS